MYDPSAKKVILSRDVKFCEGNFENIASAGEEIREESISIYHNCERDFHVIYLDNIDDDDNLQNIEPVENTGDDHNLQDIEPVGDTDQVIRRFGREKRNPSRYGDWVDADAINLDSSSEVEDLAEHATLSTVLEANIEATINQ